MNSLKLYSFLFTILIGLSISCEKDVETITETVVVTDTIFSTQIDTIFIDNPQVDTVTIIFLVRHAETTGTGQDPVLSSIGQARAEALKNTLSELTLSAIYSTELNRTVQTAQPIADAQALPILSYSLSNLSNTLDQILLEQKGKMTLIVGHSNTTPQLLNLLLGENTYTTLPESEYDNLFVVKTSGLGQSEIVHLKYGN